MTTASVYQPVDGPRTGRFIVLEGVGGVGKSTLAALLAQQLACPLFHTAPTPLTDLQPYINVAARPLAHLMFYATAALCTSDLARAALRHGDVVADRYVASVIANHAAIHHTSNYHARQAIIPFLDYLTQPDLTVYLHADLDELIARAHRRAQRGNPPRLLAEPGLIAHLRDHFDLIAAEDPTAVHLNTDCRSPAELAATILAITPARRSNPAGFHR